MRRLLLLTKFVFLFFVYAAAASTNKTEIDSLRNFNALTQTNGMTFYHPELFFAGKIAIPEIPELPYLNSETNEDFKKIAWFLASKGTAVAIAHSNESPERNTQFDLYNPVSIDIGRNEPAVELSVPQKSREAEIGKWHFGTHDAWHLAYIPGPRLADISTPQKTKESKERLVNHLLLIESYATTLSASRHAKVYWNWRNKVNGSQNNEEFERLNKGLYSISDMTESDFFDIIKAVMFGEVRNFSKTWNRFFNPELYEESRKAGVPMLFPSMKQTLGDKGEKLFLKYGFGLVAGLANYLAPASGYGHQMFKAYARMQADYYFQPWYVQWSEMFKIGLDFNAADAELARLINDLRNDRVMHDVDKPKPGVFEIMHTKNSIEQFGRRVIEFQELVKNNPTDFDNAIAQKLNNLLKLSLDLHSEILVAIDKQSKNNSGYTPNQVSDFKNKYLKLTRYAEVLVPINQSLPRKLRLPMAEYDNYWNNAYGVILPRPSGMTKFLSARGIWESARKQRVARIKSELKGVPFVSVMPEGETIDDIEKRMGIIYEDRRIGKKVDLNSTNEANEYLNSIERLKKTYKYQANQVFLEQMRDYSELSTDEIKRIFETTENLTRAIELALDQHKANYQSLFISRDAGPEVKAEFLRMEGNLKWATDQSLLMMADVLDLMDFGKPKKAIEKLNQFATETSRKLNNQKSYIIPNFKSYANYLFPKETSKIKSLCSMLTRMCFNSDISQIVKSVVTDDFKNSKIEQQIQPLNIPKNAAVILVINHDSPVEDLRLSQILSERLGLTENAIVTSKRNWPQQKLFPNRDKSILFADDNNLNEVVINKLSGANSSVTIFPEGNTPGQNMNFPLSVKPGAFSLARKSAIALKDKKPVYLVTITSNMHSHITKAEPLAVTVADVSLVPHHPISQNDKWINDQRVSFENRISKFRGDHSVDLISRTRLQNGLRVTSEPKEYIPGLNAMETVGDSWKKCIQVIKNE